MTAPVIIAALPVPWIAGIAVNAAAHNGAGVLVMLGVNVSVGALVLVAVAGTLVSVGVFVGTTLVSVGVLVAAPVSALPETTTLSNRIVPPLPYVLVLRDAR